MISTESVELHEDLKPYLTTTNFGMECIHHPLIVSIMHHEFLNEHTNKRYEYLKEEVSKCLEKGDYSRYIFLHERPYRLEALVDIMDYEHDTKNFWETVSHVYTDSENIHQHYDTWVSILSEDGIHKKHLMDDEELLSLESFDDELTVYRGFNGNGGIDGLSWTIDKKTALFFAKRFAKSDEDATIATGKIKKSDIIAYLTGRNESEVLVLPENVTDIELESLGV